MEATRVNNENSERETAATKLHYEVTKSSLAPAAEGSLATYAVIRYDGDNYHPYIVHHASLMPDTDDGEQVSYYWGHYCATLGEALLVYWRKCRDLNVKPDEIVWRPCPSLGCAFAIDKSNTIWSAPFTTSGQLEDHEIVEVEMDELNMVQRGWMMTALGLND